VRIQVGESAQVDGLAVDRDPKALVKSPPTRGARLFLCPSLPLKCWGGVDVDGTKNIQAALAETRAECSDLANRAWKVDLGTHEGEIVEPDGQTFGLWRSWRHV
jgi:hypothetical protein